MFKTEVSAVLLLLSRHSIFESYEVKLKLRFNSESDHLVILGAAAGD
jgi:hypothetical protein